MKKNQILSLILFLLVSNIIKAKTIVVVVAHPNLAASKTNKTLVNAAQKLSNLHIIDLYNIYKNETVGERLPAELLKKDQALLEKADQIVFQFPVYWFAMPSLLKKWQDEILMRGWSHMGGKALDGKKISIAVTAGEPKSNYTTENFGFSLEELLAPYQVLAKYLNMDYQTPFIVYDTYAPSEATLEKNAHDYILYLQK